MLRRSSAGTRRASIEAKTELKDVVGALTQRVSADAERIMELEAELSGARARWAEERQEMKAAQYERLVALDDKEVQCRALRREVETTRASLEGATAEGTALVRSVAALIRAHKSRLAPPLQAEASAAGEQAVSAPYPLCARALPEP
jgi:DNA repair exonuclease SbcCD ATPase subunit